MAAKHSRGVLPMAYFCRSSASDLGTLSEADHRNAAAKDDFERAARIASDLAVFRLPVKSLSERRRRECPPTSALPRNKKRPGHRGPTALPSQQLRRRYAARATVSPLKARPFLPAVTFTASSSLILPDRISSASGSCRAFWIARLSGRAP